MRWKLCVAVVLCIIVETIHSVDTDSVVKKTFYADGSKEFTIVKNIKKNECTCSCKCVPESLKAAHEATKDAKIEALPTEKLVEVNNDQSASVEKSNKKKTNEKTKLATENAPKVESELNKNDTSIVETTTPKVLKQEDIQQTKLPSKDIAKSDALLEPQNVTNAKSIEEIEEGSGLEEVVSNTHVTLHLPSNQEEKNSNKTSLTNSNTNNETIENVKEAETTTAFPLKTTTNAAETSLPTKTGELTTPNRPEIVTEVTAQADIKNLDNVLEAENLARVDSPFTTEISQQDISEVADKELTSTIQPAEITTELPSTTSDIKMTTESSIMSTEGTKTSTASKTETTTMFSETKSVRAESETTNTDEMHSTIATLLNNELSTMVPTTDNQNTEHLEVTTTEPVTTTAPKEDRSTESNETITSTKTAKETTKSIEVSTVSSTSSAPTKVPHLPSSAAEIRNKTLKDGETTKIEIIDSSYAFVTEKAKEDETSTTTVKPTTLTVEEKTTAGGDVTTEKAEQQTVNETTVQPTNTVTMHSEASNKLNKTEGQNVTTEGQNVITKEAENNRTLLLEKESALNTSRSEPEITENIVQQNLSKIEEPDSSQTVLLTMEPQSKLKTVDNVEEVIAEEKKTKEALLKNLTAKLFPTKLKLKKEKESNFKLEPLESREIVAEFDPNDTTEKIRQGWRKALEELRRRLKAHLERKKNMTQRPYPEGHTKAEIITAENVDEAPEEQEAHRYVIQVVRSKVKEHKEEENKNLPSVVNQRNTSAPPSTPTSVILSTTKTVLKTTMTGEEELITKGENQSSPSGPSLQALEKNTTEAVEESGSIDESKSVSDDNSTFTLLSENKTGRTTQKDEEILSEDKENITTFERNQTEKFETVTETKESNDTDVSTVTPNSIPLQSESTLETATFENTVLTINDSAVSELSEELRTPNPNESTNLSLNETNASTSSLSPEIGTSPEISTSKIKIQLPSSTDAFQSTALPVTESSALPITESTVLPTTESTALPVTDSTIFPVTDESTAFPIIETNAPSIKDSTSVPTRESTALATKESTALPIEDSTTLSIEESTALPTKESTALPIKESTALPTKESTALPIKESTALPIKESTALPTKESTALPIKESTALPTKESTALPTKESAVHLTTETIDQSKEKKTNEAKNESVSDTDSKTETKALLNNEKVNAEKEKVVPEFAMMVDEQHETQNSVKADSKITDVIKIIRAHKPNNISEQNKIIVTTAKGQYFKNATVKAKENAQSQKADAKISAEKQRLEIARLLREEQEKIDRLHELQRGTALKSEMERQEQINRQLEELAKIERRQREMIERQKIAQKERQRLQRLKELNAQIPRIDLSASDSTEADVRATKSPFITEEERTTKLQPILAKIKSDGMKKVHQSQCEAIRTFARIYEMQNPGEWVERNCVFARQYFPKPTCSELRQLFDSCF